MTKKEILQNRDFIIISSVDWSENWQIHQMLASSLVQSGNRVLFVENTGVRAPRLSDFSRISTRIRNWFKSTKGFSEVNENLTVFTSLFIPFPYLRFVLPINHFLLSRPILRWMKINHFNASIGITFLPTPLAISLIKDINPSITIYYCADDMAGGSAGATQLKPYEDNLLLEADAVFCTSNALIERAEKLAKKVFLFPAGVDFKKFNSSKNIAIRPPELSVIPKPIVGYVGAIRAFFDQNLLVAAAHALPDVSFVLVGPISIDVSLLTACPNITFLGKRSHDELPSYINSFDVALIPFVKNSYTDAVYSCKLNEYLALGVPVVATDMRELSLYAEQYGQVLQIAKTEAEFIGAIKSSLVESDERLKLLRIASAEKNSWDQRFLGICKVINELLAINKIERSNWKAHLINYYRRGRIKIIKFIFLLAACYMFLFFTPLVWLAGNQLVMRDQPKVSDAIVVFSGDGESNYFNQSYQRRALDAVNYFKAGYAPLIILSSGKYQTLSEVYIIRSLLIDRGVPDESIEIIDQFPISTYENVVFVNKRLIEHKLKSIIMITSPYHSRRALWVWKKVMPELLVLAPPVIDTPAASPQWRGSAGQMKVISYEYLAIAYYWCKGWL